MTQDVKASAAAAKLQVTEHYRGRTYKMIPTNWRGAKDCAIVTPTDAYCFDTAAEMVAFTGTPAALIPARKAAAPAGALVSCSGYTKIWNGANWTNVGLAFHDWGYAQNLNSYTSVPFTVRSWFSDGQRSVPANNCDARIYSGSSGSGSSVLLPKLAHALNGPNFGAYSIRLYAP